VRTAVATLESNVGPVDILVNNAGTYGGEQMQLVQFRDSEPQTWDRFIAVNLFGVINCTHAVLAGMCERQWGRVITMSSGAGATGLDIGVAAYGAGKGGSIGFTRHIALECARLGVTANSIALGRVVDDVDAARPSPPGSAALGLGKPADVGALCVYLASHEAAWMTGQTIQLNGGAVTS
jgi:NAD(P)-dependent dehydrogenase (short-subunit alcohol dehydrogenase family)